MFVQDRKTQPNRFSLFLSQITIHVEKYSWGRQPEQPLTQPASGSGDGQTVVQAEDNPLIREPGQPAITLTRLQGHIPVALLHLRGPLNITTYFDLISEAKTAYENGIRNIIFDMSDVPTLGLTSLVALHSIAVLLRGEKPLDPEQGRETLWAITRDLKSAGLQHQFKLLSPQPNVAGVLEQAGFTTFLEIFTDLKTAVNSFGDSRDKSEAWSGQQPYMLFQPYARILSPLYK